MCNLAWKSSIMRISHRWPRKYLLYHVVYFLGASKSQTANCVLISKQLHGTHNFTYTKVQNIFICQTFSNLRISSIALILAFSTRGNLQYPNLTKEDLKRSKKYFQRTKLISNIKRTFRFENHPT